MDKTQLNGTSVRKTKWKFPTSKLGIPNALGVYIGSYVRKSV